MKFPRDARSDGAAAGDRLNEARDHESRMHDALEGSRGTLGEPAAAAGLAAASEQTAAREAWLAWTRRESAELD